MVCCGDRSSVLVEWCAVVTDYQFLLSEVLWCAGNSLLHLAAKSVNQAAGIFLAQHGAAVSHANIKVGVGPLVCDECWHVVLCCHANVKVWVGPLVCAECWYVVLCCHANNKVWVEPFVCAVCLCCVALCCHADIKVWAGLLVGAECWYVVLCYHANTKVVCAVKPTSWYRFDCLFVLNVEWLIDHFCIVLFPSLKHSLYTRFFGACWVTLVFP